MWLIVIGERKVVSPCEYRLLRLSHIKSIKFLIFFIFFITHFLIWHRSYVSFFLTKNVFHSLLILERKDTASACPYHNWLMLVVLSRENISCAGLMWDMGLMRPAHTRFSEVPLVHLLVSGKQVHCYNKIKMQVQWGSPNSFPQERK